MPPPARAGSTRMGTTVYGSVNDTVTINGKPASPRAMVNGVDEDCGPSTPDSISHTGHGIGDDIPIAFRFKVIGLFGAILGWPADESGAEPKGARGRKVVIMGSNHDDLLRLQGQQFGVAEIGPGKSVV